MSVKNYPNLKIELESGIILDYPPQLDGGGLSARFDFLDILKSFNKKYENAFEWCSGFGIIGFELLGNNICKNIHFSDIFPLAIDNCLYNAKNNNILDKVFGYISGDIKSIPVKNKFDLVVANGPCDFDLKEYTKQRLKNENKISTNEMVDWDVDVRLAVDDNCKIHVEFFDNIKEKVTKDVDILLIVNTNKPQRLIESSIRNNFKIIKQYPIKYFCGGGEIYHFKQI